MNLFHGGKPDVGLLDVETFDKPCQALFDQFS